MERKQRDRHARVPGMVDAGADPYVARQAVGPHWWDVAPGVGGRAERAARVSGGAVGRYMRGAVIVGCLLLPGGGLLLLLWALARRFRRAV